MLGFSTDITEHRELEDRLRQSEKMDALGRLAGGIAHDFNNILVAVLGFGQLAQEQLKPGDPARGHVDEIVKAGESAKKLVQ
jgi:signal transduction histidine kinase